jgi:hypothetical protein
MLARVSADRAKTWGPVRDLFGVDCDAIADGGGAPDSIAAHGSRMVLEEGSCGFGFCSSGAIVTRDQFEHVSFVSLWDGRERDAQIHLVGYVTVDGRARLADAYSNGQRVRFRRALSAEGG